MYSRSSVVLAKPKISPVTIALQLLSGERLIAVFRPEGNRWLIFNLLFELMETFVFITVTLWDILQHWEIENKLEPALSSLTSEIPVCIYLRNTISGREALWATTLFQLGISNGRVAIRWLLVYYSYWFKIHVYFVHRYATKKPGILEQPHVGGTIAPTLRAQSPEFLNQLEESLAEKKIRAPAILVDEKMTVDDPAPTVETHQVCCTFKLNIPKCL